MKRIKIGFIGTQGAGKTTACYSLATKLKKDGHDVYVLSEVARSCPLPLNKDATMESQLWIFGKQLTREQSARGNILISDRTILDVFCYSMRTDKTFFKSLIPFVKKYLETYDVIFFLEPSDEYLIDDGIRSTDKEFRDEIDNIMKKYIDEFNVNVVKTDKRFEYLKENVL